MNTMAISAQIFILELFQVSDFQDVEWNLITRLDQITHGKLMQDKRAAQWSYEGENGQNQSSHDSLHVNVSGLDRLTQT